MSKLSRARSGLLVYVLLACVVVFIYWQCGHFGLLSALDDDDYITKNAMVKSGIDLGSLHWAFTSSLGGLWQPLTWVSFMAEIQARGVDTRLMHIDNVLLHIANVVLLFALLNRLTRSPWRSAFVAAVFAAHPLQIASVAWVTERKNVLSTFLLLLAISAYAWYAAEPRLRRYLVVAAAFALALLAKSMVVTLPALLLLLDYWPLRRLATDGRCTIRKLILEKIPLLMIAGACAVLTCRAMGGNVGDIGTEIIPISVRIGHAFVNYAFYLGKAFWPTRLMCMYPRPEGVLPLWHIVSCAGLFVLLTGLAVREAGRRPYLIVGWLWFVIALLPAIGIVQQGLSDVADHHAYIPIIGLLIAVAWVVPDLLGPSKSGGRITAGVGAAIVLALAVFSHSQVRYWRDSMVLLNRALDLNPRNPFVYMNLANVLYSRGEIDRSVEYLHKWVRLYPDSAPAYYCLGNALGGRGRFGEAMICYRRALKLSPRSPRIMGDIGAILAMRNDLNGAERWLRRAVELNPRLVDPRMNLGVVLVRKGHSREGLKHMKAAQQMDPGNVQTRQLIDQVKQRTGLE